MPLANFNYFGQLDSGKTLLRKPYNFSVLTKLWINKSIRPKPVKFVNFKAPFRSFSQGGRIYPFGQHPYFQRRAARAKKAREAAAERAAELSLEQKKPILPKPKIFSKKKIQSKGEKYPKLKFSNKLHVSPKLKTAPKQELLSKKKMLRQERLKVFNNRRVWKWSPATGFRSVMSPFPTEASPIFDGGLAIQNIAYLKIKALEKKKMDEYRLLLLKKKEKSKVRDVLARCRSVTLNRFFATRRNKKKKKIVKNKRSKKRKLRPWVYGRNEDERYFDTSFGQDIIDSKKKRFHMFKFNPISRKSLDLNPHKFFFYKMKKDPIYNSFLLEKVISAFATHGRHAKVRKVFYRIFLTDKYDYNIRTLYAVIGDLRPAYINVPVRMANRYYYAPIKASPMRSTMRAIRFFKKAVLSNKHEKSLEEKILAELENTFEFWGYVNPFYHDYVTMSENNKYLAHFRKRRVI